MAQVEKGNSTHTGAPVESMTYAKASLGTFLSSDSFLVQALMVMMFM